MVDEPLVVGDDSIACYKNKIEMLHKMDSLLVQGEVMFIYAWSEGCCTIW